MRPRAPEHRLERAEHLLEGAGLGVVDPERLQMLARPGLACIDARVAVGRQSLAVGQHGDGEPERPLVRLDAVAVSPAMLVVLDIVVEDEDVALVELIEVAEPRQVAGLEDDDPLRTRAGRHERHAPQRFVPVRCIS